MTDTPQTPSFWRKKSTHLIGAVLGLSLLCACLGAHAQEKASPATDEKSVQSLLEQSQDIADSQERQLQAQLDTQEPSSDSNVSPGFILILALAVGAVLALLIFLVFKTRKHYAGRMSELHRQAKSSQQLLPKETPEARD